jgi:hypothetical protein
MDMTHFYYRSKMGPKLEFIQRLMNSWDSTLGEYERKWGPRRFLPYVYGERAHIGILAIAAAKIEAFPFEEFSTKKRRGHHKGSGRADLEIIVKNKKWNFEAKRIQKSFRKADFVDAVRDKLGVATKDARGLAEAYGLRVGIVSVIPYRMTDPGIDSSQFVEKMSDLKFLDADFSAIHLAESRLYQSHPDSPGVAIVGRCVSK